MKWYCKHGEEWTLANWGVCDWLNIAAIVISLVALSIALR